MMDQSSYKKEVTEELEHILSYWITHAVDQRGGFHGQIDNNNIVDPYALKGSVLNSRILWTFSAAYHALEKKEYLEMANRAADYLSAYFIDKEYGGVYWTLTYKGEPEETKKQIYAQAFAIYGLSEHYCATSSTKSKQTAIQLYELVVQHSYDRSYGGYTEALSRDWKQTDNVQLSVKDANERKTMNTHLHVLEAFANLYRIWPDEKLKERIQELLYLFLEKIINKKTYHLDLFFDEQWTLRPGVYSYGHDIEAAWLLQEAADIIGDKPLLEKLKVSGAKIAKAAAEGLDEDGGLWYEYDLQQRHLVKEKHWWPQAEAMVGFYNVYQNTGDIVYRDLSYGSWKFIRRYVVDNQRGEWFWGVDDHRRPMQHQDKIGLWKCPYHNGRACLEIMKRID